MYRYPVEPDSKETTDSNVTPHLNFKSFGVASMSMDKKDNKYLKLASNEKENCKVIYQIYFS